MNDGNQEEIRLKGIPISRGIAIGSSFTIRSHKKSINQYLINPSMVAMEKTRFSIAMKQCREKILQLIEELEKEQIDEGAALLEAQLHLMQDPLLFRRVEEEIEKKCCNVESAFHKVLEQFLQEFCQLSSPLIHERIADLEDMKRRVLSELHRDDSLDLCRLPKDTILIAYELATSESAEFSVSEVAAFVTEKGSRHSHVAIVAKARGIPYVSGIEIAFLEREGTVPMIVDGCLGEVILYPSLATKSVFQRKKRALQEFFALSLMRDRQPSMTLDGRSLSISGNIELESDAESLAKRFDCGIGLYRSEYLFLSRNRFPSEEEQFTVYRRIVERMGARKVIIRVFDVGGDKLADIVSMKAEENPYLGLRAIRFLMKEKTIFDDQLRAILRASYYGNVGILLPMISDLQELLEIKQRIQRLHQQLQERGVETAHSIRIGCMIEVPSAALTAAVIAKECDFLSIGTNDLVQYLLAADRGNQEVSHHYKPTHPAVLALIASVIRGGHRAKIPVSICGELAADLRFLPFFIGLGVDELSVSPIHIPSLRAAITRVDSRKAILTARKVLALSGSEEVRRFLLEEYHHYFPAELIDGHHRTADEPFISFDHLMFSP